MRTYRLIIIVLSLAFATAATAANLKSANVRRFKFRFLTNDLKVVDGRPVFSPDGKYIVFMRQPNNGDPGAISALYRIKVNGKNRPELLFDGKIPGTDRQFNATRPDYSWKRHDFEIAFAALGEGIWLLDVKTKAVKQVLKNEIDGKFYDWSYPAWYRDGKSLAVTNYNREGKPLYHQLVKANADGLDDFVPLTDNEVVWPGEASVQQRNSMLLAFAGQTPPSPGPCECPGGCLPDGYAQSCNQIWIQDSSTAFPIDEMQGRAPWFSPNGKFIVFESNRDNPDNLERYRLFIYSLEDETVHAVTPPALNVQHAKWSPGGKRLAFAVQLFGGAQGIAILE